MFGQSLWNTRVVLSTIVGPGTALVGNFGQAAHIWRRGGVSVEATNSHSDLFVKDITMLRAEERLGLGLYRPAAFTAVSGLARPQKLRSAQCRSFSTGWRGRRLSLSSGRRSRSSNRRRQQMAFTDTQQDILTRAWLLARDGQGQVLEDWAEPDATSFRRSAGSNAEPSTTRTTSPTSGHARPRRRST